MRDKNEGKVPGGGGLEGTCDHGLSRRSPRVNLSRVEPESKEKIFQKRKSRPYKNY